jgi:predicted deacylase
MEVRKFLDDFGALAAARGFSARTLCGTAAGPLVAWERPGDTPPAYLSAGMHGDEPAGPLAALELLRQGAFDHGPWLLCPALNPTGLAAGTRDNAEGIDLNRDYWNRRTPEVRAHAGWLESLPCPRIFLSLHEDWETSGFYFYEINLDEDRPERAEAIFRAVEPWFTVEPAAMIDGHDIRGPGWIYHAAEADLPENWPEAIFLAKRGCPVSFTFETPSAMRLEDRVAAQVAAVKAAAGCPGGA